MKLIIIVAVLLSVAFFTGLYLTLFSTRHTTMTQTPVTREFTLEGLSAIPKGTIGATILGSISINGDIPVGSTINVEARVAGTQQFTTVVQNLPAESNQTFSYTKATSGTRYDMKVMVLDPTSKVIGTSQDLTISAPALNTQFRVNVLALSAIPTPTPEPTVAIKQTNSAPTPILLTETPTPTTTPVVATISGSISFHGAAPINSRIVVFQKLANDNISQVAVDDLVPVDGTMWQWGNSISGNSYSVIAVLKQKQSNGMDTDIATSAPVTVTSPSGFIVLTVNSYYTLTKPTGTPTVSCITYDGGPNQNKWSVSVAFSSYTGAQSYWLEVGTTAGANDIINTNGNTLSISTVFKNNVPYYARFAYATVPGVDTASGQYSIFSDSTRLSCGT